MMMSSFAYSWSGQSWNDDSNFRLDYELNLELDLEEYEDTLYVQVPLINIIGANAIYFHQVNRISLQMELLRLQDKQLLDYEQALVSAEEEVDAYKESLDVYSNIVDTKDEIIIQERRKTRIYQTSSIILLGILISTFF